MEQTSDHPVIMMMPNHTPMRARALPSSQLPTVLPPYEVANFLEVVRQHIYKVTGRHASSDLLETLRQSNSQPQPFPCGHVDPYISPAARLLVSEAEPYAKCTECLHELVSVQINGTVYETPKVAWSRPDDPARKAMAQARYYISLLQLHYDLITWIGDQLTSRHRQSDLELLNLVLWRDLMMFETDWWLSDRASISLLDGAIQFTRHIRSFVELTDCDCREAAQLLGLISHEEKGALKESFEGNRIELDDGYLWLERK